MKVAVLKHTRRKVIWPWAVLITLLLVVAIPIGLTYGLFYDDASKDITLQPAGNANNIGNRIMVDSLDKTVEEHKINAILTENDVDNMIYYGLHDSGWESKIVKKAYVGVVGNRYKFYADISMDFFKTRIRFDTILQENNDRSKFIFTVQEITIGRVGGFKKLSQSVAAPFINENSVNNFLAKTNISIKYDEKNQMFIYDKYDLYADMCRLNSSENVDLYLDIVKTMAKDNETIYNLNNDYFMDATINLEPLVTNDLVTDTPNQKLVEANEVVERCQEPLVKLVSSGAFNPSLIEPRIVFNYLFSGWDATSAEDKVYIEQINMSSIGINDKTAYKGFDLYDPDVSLQDTLVDNAYIDNLVSGNQAINKTVTFLSEETINDYLKGRNIVGYTTLLKRWDGNKYKTNFVTIDNFYCNIYGNDTSRVIEFVAKFNVNGYHTSMTFATSAPEIKVQDRNVYFGIDQIKYGSRDAINMKDDFFTLLSSALKDGDGAMIAVENDHTIRFNLMESLKVIQKNCEDKAKENAGGYQTYDFTNYFVDNNLEYTCLGENRNAVGALQIKLKEGISL